MDEIKKAAIKEFSQLLRRERRKAGDPSLRDMCRRGSTSHSTLDRALKSETRLPKWRTVQAFLDGIEAGRNTHTEVRQAWLRTAEIINPVGLTDDVIIDDGGADPAEDDTSGDDQDDPLRDDAWLLRDSEAPDEPPWWRSRGRRKRLVPPPPDGSSGPAPCRVNGQVPVARPAS